MKQVDKVSIGRMAFTIETDAHAAMKEYINSLELHYDGNPARKEIVSGIEDRIAELLIEKGYKDKSISLDAVNEIVATLGKPEDFEDAETEKTKNTKRKKKLFRDPDNKIFGGVCGGFGIFCGVDPIIFRLILAVCLLLSFFGTWWWMSNAFPYIFIAYIVLWIIIPKARTFEDRCAMHGENISLNNIQSSIEQGFGTFKNEAKGIWYNDKGTSTAGRIISIVFAALFCIIGISGLVSSCVSIFSSGFLGNIFITEALDIDNFNEYVLPVLSGSTTVKILFWTSLSLLMSIPSIALIYLGVKVIFRLKSPSWRPGLILLILWILALIVFCCVSVYCLTPLIEMEYNSSIQQLP